MNDSVSNVPVITVDGPSGSGKGTLSDRLAKHFGWHLLDSGALYRIVGAKARQVGVDLYADPLDVAALVQLAEALEVRFDSGAVFVDEVDFTARVRNEEAGADASIVAALQPVRDAIHSLQLSFRKAPGVVADGRDMGTVVFPNAPLKFFLDASAEVRARRRFDQLREQGVIANYPELVKLISDRDDRDRNRAVSPLKPAADALIIDSSSMGIDEVFQFAVRQAEERGLSPSTP